MSVDFTLELTPDRVIDLLETTTDEYIAGILLSGYRLKQEFGFTLAYGWKYHTYSKHGVFQTTINAMPATDRLWRVMQRFLVCDCERLFAMAAQILYYSACGMITRGRAHTFFHDGSFAQKFVDRMNRFTSAITNLLGDNGLPISLSLLWVVYQRSELSLAATRIYENALAARFHRLESAITTERNRLAAVRLFQICIGLQTLEIPTLLLVDIFDESVSTDWTLYKKWQLVVVVRHFLDRQRKQADDARLAVSAGIPAAD